MAQANKKRCPSCGACQECGAPANPYPVPVPYPRPWPVYPTSPYWQGTSVAPNPWLVTYSNAANAFQ